MRTRWVLRENALHQMQIYQSGLSKKTNYTELWAFLEDFSSSDKSDAGSKAAGFAQQLGRFLTYFHLAELHKNFVVIGAGNEAQQSSLTLHFQQAAKIVATLLDCLQQFSQTFTEFWLGCRQKANELQEQKNLQFQESDEPHDDF